MNSKTLIALYIVCFVFYHTNGKTTVRNVATSEDYTSIPDTKGQYKFYRAPQTFSNAKATCEREGARMFYPESESEAKAVMSFWKNKDVRNFPDELFIGIEMNPTTKELTTFDGIAVSCTYHKWTTGEPNNLDGNENCVGIQYRTYAWTMNDTPCESPRAFICKLPKTEWNPQCFLPNLDEQLSAESSVINLTDYNFIPETKGLYKFHKIPRQFNDAKKICEGEGASLFYPENKNEADIVMTFWAATVEKSFPNELLVGIGQSKNGFSTIDGISISNVYNKWLPEKPSSKCYNRNCVKIQNEAKTWMISDISCCDKLPFICKSPIIEWNRQCKVTDLDYGYAERLGKCYKLHATPKTWTEARDKCRAEHSHLAVINSHEEAEYLVRLMKSIGDDIPGNYTRGVVLLGFHNNDVEDWQIVEGTSLYNSGYACWGNSQPDGGDRQRCGSMYYNGHLNDIECDRKALFICEHDIEAPNFEYEPPSHFTVIQSLRCYDVI